MLTFKRKKKKSGLNQLKKRLLLVVLGVILLRIGVLVPIPEISASHAFILSKNKTLDTFDFLSGGSFGKMTIFSLGIMPYVSASIVMNIYANFSEKFQSLKKEGSYGRDVLDYYTRLAAIALAVVQSLFVSGWMIHAGAVPESESSILFVLVAITGMVTGTTFLIWISEQITEHGIGNGTSMIVFVGIASKFPDIAHGIYLQLASGLVSKIKIFFGLLVTIFIVLIVILFEGAKRRVRVHYAQKYYQPNGNDLGLHYMPLKVSISGVIPCVFAISCVNFISSAIKFLSFFNWAYWLKPVVSFLQNGRYANMLLTVVLITVFNFIYTPLTLNTKEIADNLRKSNSFIPGIKPGGETIAYIDGVVQKLTVLSSAYLVLITILPELCKVLWGIPVYFNGSSILISTVFIIDFFTKIQPYLTKRNRQNTERKSNIKKSKTIGMV